ncbi:hypothetical protein FYJ38_09410 [Clostridium sp. WB02_MRS01]|uniref:hypothetical protein n=1 Tax=Clostridium sp. WB02_MRS01 TaxID=2605777 RepID=UPI0012B1A3CD|nr:hypothetical protein [Clostridium sp. WB02_MRS01]MSS08863.1 hypothetical protein [Clostridium sp. WB02_MRS01]
MGRQVRKILFLTGLVSLALFGGAMASYAAGPGEVKTDQTVAKPVTYNQQAVKALGNWEQQGSVWRFRCLDGNLLTNAWLENLKEASTYYYVDVTGVMLINSKTPDGYWVDGNGLWRNGIDSTVPSVSGSNSSVNNKSTNRYDDDEISPETIEMINRMAGPPAYGGLH